MTDTKAPTAAPEPNKGNELAKRSMEQRVNLENALVVHGDDGSVTLAIPPELSQKYNVLAPAAVLRQADPYFRPSFTVIQLDPKPGNGDFYEMTGANKGKVAMTKDAILKIANAGGIDFSQDPGGKESGDPMPVFVFGEHVMDARLYTYTALGRFRKSDGTTAAMKAEKEWHPQLEALQKEADAKTKDKAWVAKKEFLRSLEFRSMMTKAKAQNAVMRSAYGIKQKFTPQEAAKPFFVVSYNFTAGTDPNALAIVASLVGADVANLYGTDAPALPQPVDDMTPVIINGVTVDVETGEYTEPEDAGTPEILDADEAPAPEAPELPDDYGPGVMPQRQACEFVIRSGKYKDEPLPIEDIDRLDPTWLSKTHEFLIQQEQRGTISEGQQEILDHLSAFYLHKEQVV